MMENAKLGVCTMEIDEIEKLNLPKIDLSNMEIASPKYLCHSQAALRVLQSCSNFYCFLFTSTDES